MLGYALFSEASNALVRARCAGLPGSSNAAALLDSGSNPCKEPAECRWREIESAADVP